MPIFWDEEQLKWLEGSYLLTQIADRKRNIKADYDEICRVRAPGGTVAFVLFFNASLCLASLPTNQSTHRATHPQVAPEFAELADLHEWSMARMMVASRNFGVNFRGTKTDALVPLADMLNHYRPRETRWTFDNSIEDGGGFTITSLTRLAAGQQVFDSYGKKCASRFLLNYGFAVDNNRDPDGQCHNEVRVTLRMKAPAHDPLHATKLGLLNGTSTVRGIRVSTWYELESTKEAFSFLRFAHAEATEVMLLPQLSEGKNFTKQPVPPISPSNEANVLRTFRQVFQQQLNKYPTSLEEDIATLDAGTYPFGSNRRNALVVVKGEKEVCHHFLQLADECIPLLEMEVRLPVRFCLSACLSVCLCVSMCRMRTHRFHTMCNYFLQWAECKKATQRRKRAHKELEDYISKIVLPLVRRQASRK